MSNLRACNGRDGSIPTRASIKIINKDADFLRGPSRHVYKLHRILGSRNLGLHAGSFARQI